MQWYWVGLWVVERDAVLLHAGHSDVLAPCGGVAAPPKEDLQGQRGSQGVAGGSEQVYRAKGAA